MINSDETHLKENSHILHELTEGFDNNHKDIDKTIITNFKILLLKYHEDKNTDKSKEAKEKTRALLEFRAKINSAIDKTKTIADLKKQYPNSSLNFLSSDAFGAQRKPPVKKKPEDNKPFDPIKPEDKEFFESFKRNYYEKSTAIYYTIKFDEKGLEKCFISFRDREYKKFTKSTNKSGTIEFRYTSTFDKTTYESYIFFTNQPNPEAPSNDQIILESYKQAVEECQIAKPDDLSNPEKPSQNKAGDEYTFSMFKDAFIKSYTDANQNKRKNTNQTYLTDRLKDRIEIFTGKKTKDYIEPKSPSIKEGMSMLEYDKLKNTYEIKYAEYEALNSIFDRLCRNDDVKKFLAKEKTKYEDEKKLQDAKAAEAKKAEKRELKERENSLEGRWHSLTRSLFELKENASSTIAGVGSSIANASSEIGSSLGGAPSAVHGFSSNFAESAKKEVDSLAITISTSVTTTFTQFSSTAMVFLTSMKLPEIKINLPSDTTNAPSEEEPATHNETKRRREDPRPEPKASKRARPEPDDSERARTKTEAEGGAEKAKEAAKEAREAAKEAREAAKEAEQAIERAKKERAADITPPTSQPPRPDVAFFGPKAKCHTNNKASRSRSSSLDTTKPNSKTSPRVKNFPDTNPQGRRNRP